MAESTLSVFGCVCVCMYVIVGVIVVLLGVVVVMLVGVGGMFRWIVHGAPVGGEMPSLFPDDEG